MFLSNQNGVAPYRKVGVHKMFLKGNKMLNVNTIGSFYMGPGDFPQLAQIIDIRDGSKKHGTLTQVSWKGEHLLWVLEDATFAPPGFVCLQESHYMKWDRQLVVSGDISMGILTARNSSRTGRHGDQDLLLFGRNLAVNYARKGEWEREPNATPTLALEGGVRRLEVGFKTPEQWPYWPNQRQVAISEGYTFAEQSSSGKLNADRLSGLYWSQQWTIIVGPTEQVRLEGWGAGPDTAWEFLHQLPVLKKLVEQYENLSSLQPARVKEFLLDFRTKSKDLEFGAPGETKRPDAESLRQLAERFQG